MQSFSAPGCGVTAARYDETGAFRAIGPGRSRTITMSAGSAYDDDERRWSGWMAAAHRGDATAYRRLLDELGDCIEAYVRVRFGALPFLEDCVQECLIAVHNARHTYDPARAFRPWLFTIVRHKTIDMLRKSRRDADGTATLVADAAVDERTASDLNAIIDGVRVLRNIAPDHRDAVALTQYAGYTVPEAARELGISESALKARLRRALIAIRREINREDAGA